MQYFVYISPAHIPLVIFPCSYPPLKKYDIYGKFAVKQHKSEGGGGGRWMNELTTFLGLIFFLAFVIARCPSNEERVSSAALFLKQICHNSSV